MPDDGPIFIDINPDDPEVSVIESMCMYCHKNGKTCILLTKIPFFKGKSISKTLEKFPKNRLKNIEKLNIYI